MKSRKKNIKSNKQNKTFLLFIIFGLFSFLFFNFVVFALDISNVKATNIIVSNISNGIISSEETIGPGGLTIPILQNIETIVATKPTEEQIIINQSKNKSSIDDTIDTIISETASISINADSLDNNDKYGKIYEHDGVYYMKGENYGNFSLTGFCACKICGSGTGYTASGKKVRENHTVAADWNLLPKNTMIILENAVGKDGTVYDGVYQVEDKGGGVKNKHIDIYRPTHELAALVTHYGRAYGDVYIAVPINIASLSQISNN